MTLTACKSCGGLRALSPGVDTCATCSDVAEKVLRRAVGPSPGYITVKVNGYGDSVSIAKGDMVTVGADGLLRAATKSRMDQATELARRELEGMFSGVESQRLVAAIAEASAATGVSMAAGVAAVKQFGQAMKAPNMADTFAAFDDAVGSIGKMRMADLVAKIAPMKSEADRVRTDGVDAMAHALGWTDPQYQQSPPDHPQVHCTVNLPDDFDERVGLAFKAKGPARPMTAEVERLVTQFEKATAPTAPRQSYIITDCGEPDRPEWENPRTAIQPSDFMCPYCYEDAPETGACPRGCNASPTGMWRKDKVHAKGSKGTKPDPSKALADLVKARDAVNRCGRCKAVEPGMCSSHQSDIDYAMRQAQAAAPALPKDAVTIAGRTYEWSQHRSAAVRGQMFELRKAGPGNPVLKSFVLRDVEMETADRSAILIIKKSMAEAELRDVVEALAEDA